MNRSLSIRLNRLLGIVLVSGSLLLSACIGRPTPSVPDFGFALPESWDIVSVNLLDTDGDGEEEWAILYSFDQPANKAFTPVRCAVYHIARREPKLPIVYPYHLQAPSWTYLGEGTDRTSVAVQDIVTRLHLDPAETYAPSDEVIVQSKSADGFVNRVSIFQWRDNVQDKLQDPYEILVVPHASQGRGQWYQCIGLFEGTLKVDVQVDRVAVWNRTNDRSQLAQINTYEPTGGPGGYLDDRNQLAAPVSSCLDFAFGMPEDVGQSPYPEKIVLAFHKTFLTEPDYGAHLLTENARQKRPADQNWQIFAPTTRHLIQRTCMKRVSYMPTAEAEAEIQVFTQGETKVTASVETLIEYDISGQQLNPIWIEWELVRNDNVWRIDGIRSVRAVE